MFAALLNLLNKVRRYKKYKKILLAALVLAALLLSFVAYAVWNSGPRPCALNSTPLPEIKQRYDLVVVGAEPEGIAAAVSGARSGLSVLLVDTGPELGGLFTRGWLNSIDMNYGPDGKILNQGFFLEFYKRTMGHPFDVKGNTFDVDGASWTFNRLVNAEKHLDVLPGVDSVAPLVEKTANRRQVAGVRIMAAGQQLAVAAPGGVIDATQSGDLAALAGVTFSVGQADIGRPDNCMASTLVFKITGVGKSDWRKIVRTLWLDDDKYSGANFHSAWGFGEITSRYRPSSDRLVLRGLNIGRQNDGSLLINALLVFGNQPQDYHQAYALADAELPGVTAFLRQNVPGFEQAKLAGAAPELYVRESRHMDTEYRLTLDDVLENKDFADRIALGSYPVDIQSSSPTDPGVVIGVPQQYAVPFRCLVPRKVDGLLVVGRAAGFDSLAYGSVRTVPVGMAEGQAAGVAAAVALEHRVSFRRLAADKELIKELQDRLGSQGVVLKPFSIKNELAGHWAYDGLKFVRGLGLAIGGYDNKYQLDGPIKHDRFLTILARAVQQRGLALQNPSLFPEANVFNIYDASYALTSYLGLHLSKDKSYAYLKEKGFFSAANGHWRQYENHDTPLTNGAAYMLLKDFIAYAATLQNTEVAR